MKYIIHEGEILLKEKYGSSYREIYYVKPPGQGNLVVMDDTSKIDYYGWIAKIFLPQGFPDSVTGDYIPYQIWDTAQAFCSTIAGTLATQEVLRSVGVGDATATPLGATITWVVKDGCGHMGRILFAWSHGTHLDAYSKRWRLYADCLNDAAMCMELALPLFKNYTTIVLCISTMMKAIVGVAGSATRLAMTQHHAVRGNMADVSAKDSAQETAVNLVASIVAIFIIKLFGSSVFIFSIMVMLHIIFNYFAVRAVCLRTLNEPRYLQLIYLYLSKEVIATPCDINKIEPVVFYEYSHNALDAQLCGFQIKLGQSLKCVLKHNPTALFLNTLNDIYLCNPYIIIPNTDNRVMYVLIKESATADDILFAFFHAFLLSIITCAVNDVPLDIYANPEIVEPRPFAAICHTLQEADWTREPKENFSLNGLRYNPSFDLMRYVCSIAHKEWYNILLSGLKETGWELRKHLLILDEWRVSKHTLETNIAEKCCLRPQKLKIMEKSLLDLLKYEEKIDKQTAETFTIEPATGNDDSMEDIETVKQENTKSLLNLENPEPDFLSRGKQQRM